VEQINPRRYERFVAGFPQRGPTRPAAPPAGGTAALRARLGRLDAVEIESLCLDHCRRNPDDAARLATWLS
jgi:hypothetical protein